MGYSKTALVVLTVFICATHLVSGVTRKLEEMTVFEYLDSLSMRNTNSDKLTQATAADMRDYLSRKSLKDKEMTVLLPPRDQIEAHHPDKNVKFRDEDIDYHILTKDSLLPVNKPPSTQLVKTGPTREGPIMLIEFDGDKITAKGKNSTKTADVTNKTTLKNGYVYRISELLEAPETLEKVLNANDCGLFYKAYVTQVEAIVKNKHSVNNVTMFAPNDKAVGTYIKTNPKSLNTTIQGVMFHMINSIMTKQYFKNNAVAPEGWVPSKTTISGDGDLDIKYDEAKGISQVYNHKIVRTLTPAIITKFDLLYDNGVVHTIDAVLSAGSMVSPSVMVSAAIAILACISLMI